MPSRPDYVCLTDHCVLKRLEEPFLYDMEKDELYELGTEAYEFLLHCCRGEKPLIRAEDEAFIQFCLSENLIAFSDEPMLREVVTHPSPVPSLRYLELQITDRCNLKCRHCYLGDSLLHDLPVEKIKRLAREFEEIQGLRLLISGGEPLLHPGFWEINRILDHPPFRTILLSNGILITKEVARKLNVSEVQVSLDGMKKGHEILRGKDTFERTLEGIEQLRDAGIPVSVATMIHRGNVEEFGELAAFVASRDILEWSIDLPCIKGRLEEHPDLWVPPGEASRFLSYGYGGGWHGSEGIGSCGAHLCAVLPTGRVCKCGVFSEEPVGVIDEGLRVCWGRIPSIPLHELNCDCPEKEECRGGCRYRARLHGDPLGPDPFQCHARGVLKGGEKGED